MTTPSDRTTPPTDGWAHDKTSGTFGGIGLWSYRERPPAFRARGTAGMALDPGGIVSREPDDGSRATKQEKPRRSAAFRCSSSNARQWRRRELNPRPETSQIAASTCLVGVLSLDPGDGRRHSSSGSRRLHLTGDQRPSFPASPRFAASRLRAGRECRGCL